MSILNKSITKTLEPETKDKRRTGFADEFTCCWTMSWNEQRMMCESPSSSKAHGHSYDESPEQIDSTKTKEKMKQKPPSRLIIVDASGADRPIKSRRMASKITETNGSVHRTNLKNVVAVVPVENFGKNKNCKRKIVLRSTAACNPRRVAFQTERQPVAAGCFFFFHSPRGNTKPCTPPATNTRPTPTPDLPAASFVPQQIP